MSSLSTTGTRNICALGNDIDSQGIGKLSRERLIADIALSMSTIFGMRLSNNNYQHFYCVREMDMLQPICEISRFMKWLIFLAFS